MLRSSGIFALGLAGLLAAGALAAPPKVATGRETPSRETPPARETAGQPGDEIPTGPATPQLDTPTPDKVVNYQKSTPEEDAQAIADAQKHAADASAEMKIKFTELQTPHFIIFTDWDAREHAFLKTNVEGAYTAVSRQFEMSPKDNIFVGKLPIFMFSKREDFRRFAEDIDAFPPPRDLAGYYRGRSDGFGHMAMWKPDLTAAGGNVKTAERQWAYILTHEFTHAFVARYRSNRRVPRWLNEGIAEIIANSQFPRPGYRDFAKRMALANRRVSTIFDDERMPSGDLYPVMMTMTEALANENRKKFLKFFNEIKDGSTPEDALMLNYKVDYVGLEEAWRKFMKTAK